MAHPPRIIGMNVLMAIHTLLENAVKPCKSRCVPSVGSELVEAATACAATIDDLVVGFGKLLVDRRF